MRRSRIHRFIWLLVTASIVFTIGSFPAVAQTEAQPDLSITYSDRGKEVIEVQITDKVINADGSVSANVVMQAKSTLTYGFLVSVENGQVTGPAIEKFLRITPDSSQTAIPFVGERPLDLGQITFGPDAHLKIRLNKFGLIKGDAIVMLTFDFAAALYRFAGFGALPTKDSDWFASLGENMVQFLKNPAFDTLVFEEQLAHGEYLDALRTLADIVQKIPAAFSDFIFTQFGTRIASEVIKDFAGKLLHLLPIVSTIPVLADLALRPREAEVDIRIIGPANLPAYDAVVTKQSSSVVVSPGQALKLSFTVHNSGYLTWPARGAVGLMQVGGERFGLADWQTLPAEVRPFHDLAWELPVTAPQTNGDYPTRWQMAYRDSATGHITTFGPEVAFSITVLPNGGVPDLGEIIRQLVEQALQEARQRLEALIADLLRQFAERLQEELARLLAQLQCVAVPGLILTSTTWLLTQRRRGGK